MQSTSDACPLLGIQDDETLRFTGTDERHRCHALPWDGEFAPDLAHQVQFCLAADHTGCARFRSHQEGPPENSLTSTRQPQQSPSTAWRGLRVSLWALVGLALLLVGSRLATLLAAPSQPSVPAVAVAAQTSDTPTPVWPTPPPGDRTATLEVAATPTPQAAVRLPTEPQAPPTLAAGDVLIRLTPEPDAVGWVVSSEDRGNHFGDSYLYAGVFDREVFHSAMRFDLSRLARGAPIRYASLVLTGLDDRRLNRESNDSWSLRWLAPQINEEWARLSFQELHNAPVIQTLLPLIAQADLGPGAVNQVFLNGEQLALLEQAVVDEQTLLALRLDGPEAGTNSLYSWDTGYGPETAGSGPVLIVVAGPPPATPPPVPTKDYIVVTSTPTPENVLTAAAIVQTATAVVEQIGTPTPTPRAMVTATPTPANEATAAAERLALGLPPVITNTPEPANQATETMSALYATAVALTTGTPPPVPETAVTATPTPTWVVVTNTPTPQNVATLLAQVVAEATRTATAGPPTAIPVGVATATSTWTATPVPLNQATADAQVIWATIRAILTGTPTPTATITPTPAAVQTTATTATVTPTPTLLATATPAPTATPVPLPIPTPTQPGAVPAAPQPTNLLPGRVVFLSDRLGTPQLFVMDSECVARLGGCEDAEIVPVVNSSPYNRIQELETFAPDRQQRVFVQADSRGTPQVYVLAFADGAIRQLIALGGAAYDPTWSPRADVIALVTNDPGNDDVYTVNLDGNNLRRLTSSLAGDKHPSWSPDGTLILFYSNRDGGRDQLWVMNANGSDQRNISNNPYNDWDPIWIK